MREKNSELFICQENRFRSPSAEAFFRQLLQKKGIADNWMVGSAGSWTKNGLSPIPSVKWLQENLGLDLSKHQSRLISQDLLVQSDLIILMEKNQKEAL
jgi:protein-tyrosine phosphatase